MSLTLALETGAFGVVSLVKEQSTGHLYAMKEASLFHSSINVADVTGYLLIHNDSYARPICCAKAKKAMFEQSEISSSPHLW